MKADRNWSAKFNFKKCIFKEKLEDVAWFIYLVHVFSHEYSIFLSEQENFQVMFTSIICLNLFIIKYVMKRCMAHIVSTVGRIRKEAAWYILRNVTSETNIESNAFSHAGKESRNYSAHVRYCFLTCFLVLLLESLWQKSC